MPKDTKLNIVVDNAQAIPAIDETGRAVENLRKTSRGASKDTGKDWGGIADLFSSVLPRGLSKSLRSFKSTGRQVGRLSMSFKVLKGAIASTGIGLLVIALGELAANWDAVSEALGLTNKEQEENAKRTDQIRKAQGELTLQMQTYLETIKYNTASEEERAFAITKLNQALGNVIDTEATRTEQAKQAIVILEAKNKLIQAESDLEVAREEKLVKRIALEKELEGTNRLLRRRELQEEILNIDVEFLRASEALVTAETEINTLLTKGTELRNDRADAERKADAATAKRKALRESNAEFLLQLEKDLNEQILLAGIDGEQKRAEKVLELRHLEGVEKAKIAGATKEQLLLIEDGYLLDLAALQARFKDDDDHQAILDDREALRDEMRRADLQDNEKDVQQAQDLLEERLELAHGDAILEQEAWDLNKSEIDAITVKWRDKKAADDQAAKDKEIADDQEILNLKIQGFVKLANATAGIFKSLEGMAEEDSKKQKALAITGVLLNQATAVANSIAGATKAGNATGAAAPYTTPVFILQMVGHALASFVGIKKILNQADAASGGIGGGAGGNGSGGNPTVPLIPLGRLGSPDTNNQAYVVQSQLEGQNLNAKQLMLQTVL